MLEKNVPEYYPAMYQDGYTPTEILAAMRKKLRKNVQEQRWNGSLASSSLRRSFCSTSCRNLSFCDVFSSHIQYTSILSALFERKKGAGLGS